jgi:hypothetical protein
LFRRHIKSNGDGSTSVEKQFAKTSSCSFEARSVVRVEVFCLRVTVK